MNSTRALGGVGLFAFIPVVLYLFVGQPRPLGVALGAGVALMIAHRFLARPYMRAVAPYRDLWSGGFLSQGEGRDLPLQSAAGGVEARVRDCHRDSALRFFSFLWTWRWPMRLGIFVPLLALLITIGLAASGRATPLPTVTSFFRFVIGCTVNFGAWGYLLVKPREPARVPFPVHNFFLLGIRPLLWVFRLVGIWWILLGSRGLGWW